jgi:hypothetical protein
MSEYFLRITGYIGISPHSQGETRNPLVAFTYSAYFYLRNYFFNEEH